MSNIITYKSINVPNNLFYVCTNFKLSDYNSNEGACTMVVRELPFMCPYFGTCLSCICYECNASFIADYLQNINFGDKIYPKYKVH